jgi:hypothetical protein
MFMFCGAGRPGADMSGPVQTSRIGFNDTMLVVPRRLATVFHGSCCTAKAFPLALMRRKGNGISKQDEDVMISTGWTRSAVAAASGRGFESRRPEAFILRAFFGYLFSLC